MRERGCALRIGLLTLAAACASCATVADQPTLTLEQHTLRIPLTVEADRSVSLAERPPLTGRIDLGPILEAEGIRAWDKTTVQLMVHYGRLYLVADGFRAVWEITPRPGTSTASYRPVSIVGESGGEPLKDVRLSRYGSSRQSCLRLDRADGSPVFITSGGEARDECP